MGANTTNPLILLVRIEFWRPQTRRKENSRPIGFFCAAAAFRPRAAWRALPATRKRLFKPTRNDTESIRELPSTDWQQDWSARRFPSVKPAKRAFRVPRTRRSVSGVARQARRAGMETRLRARRPVLRSTQCVGGSLEREDATTDRSRRKPTDAHAGFRGRAQRKDVSD